MKIRVTLYSQSQGIEFANVTNTYTKDGFYCVYLGEENLVYKYPMQHIFNVKETYKTRWRKKMKIRGGFVSNSSSSSFVLIAPIDFDPFATFENADEQAFMRENLEGNIRKVLGQDVQVWNVYNSSEGIYDILEADGFEDLVSTHCEDEDDKWEYSEGLFNKFYKAFVDNDNCFVDVTDN